MIQLIDSVRAEGDSIGGVVSCIIRGLPSGIGEPVFDRLPAKLAQAMLSINATKGFEIGAGFSATQMRGSEHNDPMHSTKGDAPGFLKNDAGGVLGGISTGEDIKFRVAFKPTSSIGKEQPTVDANGEATTVAVSGRHDPCIVPRAVPIVEAMAALTICDLMLLHRARSSF